jgi:hypothetical protein
MTERARAAGNAASGRGTGVAKCAQCTRPQASGRPAPAGRWQGIVEHSSVMREGTVEKNRERHGDAWLATENHQAKADAD